jgi:hypothetical protein
MQNQIKKSLQSNNNERSKKTKFTRQNLFSLQQTVFVAKEMGKGLGGSQIL